MSTIIIPLTQGYETVIDECDAHLAKSKWYAHQMHSGIYARNRARQISLHNAIMQPPEGLIVDHIDRDPLNNKRVNLRLCTIAQNNANSAPRGKGSKFKGVKVIPDSKQRPWCATLKGRYLGSFSSERSAAIAYDIEALNEYGQYAWLNVDHFDLL